MKFAHQRWNDARHRSQANKPRAQENTELNIGWRIALNGGLCFLPERGVIVDNISLHGQVLQSMKILPPGIDAAYHRGRRHLFI